MRNEDFDGKSGKLVKGLKAIYETFEPNMLPLKIEYDEEMIKLLSDAILSIGNLSNAGKRLPNPHLLIAPYMNKEAVFSSKIEGTRTSLSEVFLYNKETKQEDADLIEVLNYIRALKFGLKEIEDKPISEKLIKEMHKILMKGVKEYRGENKDPGEYKSMQNWIGSSDDIIEAKFVPSSPETTPKLMENLIDYLNHYEKTTELIKSAVTHYQFETIHPFRDGNGRIGRLLIILFLCKSGVLSQPLLYLSVFFENNRERYNEFLFNVSAKNKINDWLKFFLKGIKIQSDHALNTVTKLDNYRENCRRILSEKTRSTKALIVLDSLFANPFITIPEVMKVLKSHYPTAKNNVDVLIQNNILKEFKDEKIKKQKNNAEVFYAPQIQKIIFDED